MYSIQIATGDEVIIENFLPEVHKVLLEGKKFSMMIDDASLFALLYFKIKTKNVNKKSFVLFYAHIE